MMHGSGKKMYNILYSTTRQWNVGDEFIHKGIKNVIEEIYGKPSEAAWSVHSTNRLYQRRERQ